MKPPLAATLKHNQTLYRIYVVVRRRSLESSQIVDYVIQDSHKSYSMGRGGIVDQEHPMLNNIFNLG